MATGKEVPIRIQLVRPPPDVYFCLQRGKDQLVDSIRSTGDNFVFNLSVTWVEQPDGPDFRGPFVQGPRGCRFIYVNSGRRAGDAATLWDRRAKIHLSGMGAEVLAQAANKEGTLLARIAGTARDGGPACATVPILDGGWQLVAV